MNPPPRLFGFPARWRTGAVPAVFAAFEVADFRVRALRWELRDVSVDGLKLGSDGHIVSFTVEADQSECALFQQDSVFYHEEASSRLTCLEKKLAQSDGISTPRWHKVDRQWPVEDGRPFEFVGQSYFDSKVVYLFRHPVSLRFAVFSDDVERQDAEEHYADEEKRG